MRFNLAVLLMLLALTLGCDVDRPKATSTCGVIGQLTLDDQAISNVKVVFVPLRAGAGDSPSRIASGLTNDRGEFVLEVDSRKPKQIAHCRYRVIVSKIVDGKEIFHESYNSKSRLLAEINSQEAIQRPKLDLVSTGTL